MPNRLRGYSPSGQGVTHIGPTAEELRRRFAAGQVGQRDIAALGAAVPVPGLGGGLAGAAERHHAAARQANEARYASILAGYRERETLGEDAFAPVYSDIERMGRLRSEQMGQNLVQRGLSGSSLQTTMQTGIDREVAAETARARLLEAQYRNQLSGERLAFMERRTDAYPDLNRAAGLEQQAGFHGLDEEGRPPSYDRLFGGEPRAGGPRARGLGGPAGPARPPARTPAVEPPARTPARTPAAEASGAMTYYGPAGPVTMDDMREGPRTVAPARPAPGAAAGPPAPAPGAPGAARDQARRAPTAAALHAQARAQADADVAARAQAQDQAAAQAARERRPYDERAAVWMGDLMAVLDDLHEVEQELRDIRSGKRVPREVLDRLLDRKIELLTKRDSMVVGPEAPSRAPGLPGAPTGR